MTILHATSLEGRLGDEVVEHIVVLHLCHADEGTPHVRQHVGTHISEHTRHILQLAGILHAVPSLGRQILIVVLACIVAGIKEIFLIVKAYGIHLKFLLSRSGDAHHEQSH